MYSEFDSQPFSDDTAHEFSLLVMCPALGEKNFEKINAFVLPI